MAIKDGNRRVSVTISDERYDALVQDAEMSGVSSVSKVIAQRLDEYDELVTEYNDAHWLVRKLAKLEVVHSMFDGDWATVHVELDWSEIEGRHGALGRAYQDAMLEVGERAEKCYLEYCKRNGLKPAQLIGM